MKITVRKVYDSKNGKIWFQEKTERGKWIDIPETTSSCEGNARFNLEKYMIKIRERHFEIMRDYGQEETFEVYPDDYDDKE